MNIYDFLLLITKLLIPLCYAAFGVLLIRIKVNQNRTMLEKNEIEKIERLKIGIQRIDVALKDLPEGVERKLQIKNREFLVNEIFKLVPLHDVMNMIDILEAPQ